MSESGDAQDPPPPPPLNPTVQPEPTVAQLFQTLAVGQIQQNELLHRLTQVAEKEPPPPLEPKANKPFTFNGDRSQCANFIARIQEYMSLTKERYPTARQSIIFVATFLSGDAQNWWRGLLRQNYHYSRPLAAAQGDNYAAQLPDDPDEAGIFLLVEETPFLISELLTLSEFYAAIHRAFGDRNASVTASNALRRLVQTTSVAAYASKFKMYCYLLDDTDRRRADMFYDGLKPEVKTIIATSETGKPKILDDMVERAVNVDIHLQERKNEVALERAVAPRAPFPNSRAPSTFHRPNTLSGNPTTSYQPPNPSRGSFAPRPTFPPRPNFQNQPSGSSGPGPMQLAASNIPKKGSHIPQAEYDRRRQYNLCLYCGMAGHSAVGCPNKTRSSTTIIPKNRRIASAQAPSIDSAQTSNRATGSNTTPISNTSRARFGAAIVSIPKEGERRLQ